MAMERMPKISDGSQVPIVGKPVPRKQGKPQGMYRPKREESQVPIVGKPVPNKQGKPQLSGYGLRDGKMAARRDALMKRAGGM